MTQHAYVDDAYIKSVGLMPTDDVVFLRAQEPEFVDGTYLAVSRIFDAKLTKRYVTPFGLESGSFVITDVPEAVRFNVAQVCVSRMFAKRGFNPGSKQDEDVIIGERDRAFLWLNEAADAEKGFIELPRRALEPDVSAVAKGSPKVYSEQSPYAGFDRQGQDGRDDDARGSGRMR